MTDNALCAASRPTMVRAARLAAVFATAVVMAGCATATPAAPAAPSEIPTPAGSLPAPTRAAPVADPLAFFRAQEQACRAHAEEFGNSQVESERFTGATLVRELDGDSFLVADGLGTRLVVRPAAGIVLPESGVDTDVMPAPYGFGCPSEVFMGAAED